MIDTVAEITDLEERLRQAEMGPDPEFFQDVIADEAALVSQEGPSFAKTQVVEAHRPGSGTKFTRVEMSDMNIIDHGDAAAVTCTGYYECQQWQGTLKLMRVWLKKDGRWHIGAGSVLS